MAKKIIRVSPSLLAADFLNLKKDVNKASKDFSTIKKQYDTKDRVIIRNIYCF